MFHGLLMAEADCREVTRRVSEANRDDALADDSGYSITMNKPGRAPCGSLHSRKNDSEAVSSVRFSR